MEPKVELLFIMRVAKLTGNIQLCARTVVQMADSGYDIFFIAARHVSCFGYVNYGGYISLGVPGRQARKSIRETQWSKSTYIHLYIKIQ